MTEIKYMPQVETESTSKGAQRARYTAYMQCVRKLEMKEGKEKEVHGGSERGGARA